MSAITAAVTAAKATIDRLLSNGNASATSGLGKGEQWDSWAYLVEERRSACAATIKAVLDSGLLPDELRDQWKARMLKRLALREEEDGEEIPGGLLWLNRLAPKSNAWEASNYATRGAVWGHKNSILDLAKHYAALNAEREQQHRDLLDLINEM